MHVFVIGRADHKIQRPHDAFHAVQRPCCLLDTAQHVQPGPARRQIALFRRQIRTKPPFVGNFGPDLRDMARQEAHRVDGHILKFKRDYITLFGKGFQCIQIVISRDRCIRRYIARNGAAHGVRCNIGSARLKPGDVLELGPKAREMALVLEAQSLAERDIPDYVQPDGNDKITFTRVPKLDEVPYPVTMEPNLVVEFYSR